MEMTEKGCCVNPSPATGNCPVRENGAIIWGTAAVRFPLLTRFKSITCDMLPLAVARAVPAGSVAAAAGIVAIWGESTRFPIGRFVLIQVTGTRAGSARMSGHQAGSLSGVFVWL